jgi:phosphatidylglycerophosphatase A
MPPLIKILPSSRAKEERKRRLFMKKIVLAFATGFGSGYAPIASGTFGTAVAILYYLCVMHLEPAFYLLFCVAFTFFAIWTASIAEKHFGKKDPGEVVIDEIIGYLITMFMIEPAGITIVAGFFIFRFFDIVKPPPVRYIDKNMPGGAGIVLDDVMAGVYSWIVMYLIFGGGL